MATTPIKVVAQADTFRRISRSRPLSAIGELIWNSLDADATSVTVYFDQSELAGLKGVIVEDDGNGMTPTEAKEYFSKLGGSWKRLGAQTKKHKRALHGNLGQGRYKALSIGAWVTWRFFYQGEDGLREFTVEILDGEFAKVVELPKREQDDLAKLLEETTLSSIISAAKIISDRLNFLRGLYQIVYEYEKDGRIKERAQLHRILALNAWLFGEEFSVSVDDRDLTAALKAHKTYLGEDIVIDDPVKHVDQTRGVVDLMLSRLLRRYRDDEVEHLVIELKRPGVSVGVEEINQITKYAASIEGDRRFETRQGVVWHFWVISDKLDKFGVYEAKRDPTGRGLIRDTPTAKIYIKTWDQLINECKSRYQFVQERLNFTAEDERATRYLRKEHAALLEGITVASDSKEEVEQPEAVAEG